MFRKIIKGLKDVWCGTLEFDTEPKKGSFNPVTSGGVYDAINGAGGGKEIVYFDVDPSDPPSGIYKAIGEALSNNKEPVIKNDGTAYFYSSTSSGKYVFVGGYDTEVVNYTTVTVSDDDSVVKETVDTIEGMIFPLYYHGTGEGFTVADKTGHALTKTEIANAYKAGQIFMFSSYPASNTQAHWGYCCDINIESDNTGYADFLILSAFGGDSYEWQKFHIMLLSNTEFVTLEGPYTSHSRGYSGHFADGATTVSVSTSQNFNATQKAQGRDNIGAASVSDVTALQSQVSSLSDVSAYTVKGEATVAQLNAGPSGIQAGWAYQLTDSGTLTEGSLAVVAGDTVAWDGTKWFPLVRSDYYATKTYAQNVAHSIAPDFDPTKPNDASGYAYYAGEIVSNNGATYRFKVNHPSGAWNPAEVDRYVAGESLKFFLVTNNPEYLYAVTDKDGVFLFGIKKDGSVDWQAGIPKPIMDKFGLLIDAFTVGEFEDAVEAKIDSVGRVLEFLKNNGERTFYTPVAFRGGIKWDESLITDLERALRTHGFSGGSGDWTDKTFISLPKPRCAIVNFSGIDSFPTTKGSDVPCVMELWDGNGNYFKKYAVVNPQGNTTLRWPKKSIAVDLFNDESRDDSCKVKFGDWPAFDSYHLKAFYDDFYKCVGCVSYDIIEEMWKSRGPLHDAFWKEALIDQENYPEGRLMFGAEDDYGLRLDTGALCLPQGFPSVVFLNGEFYGIFPFQIKKARDNYHLSKSDEKHIHIDGYFDQIFGKNGDIDWTYFEVRNPKDLINMDGSKYDGDDPKELIDSSSPSWTGSSKQVHTQEVKEYIIALSEVAGKLETAVTEYGVNSAEFKEVFETYFDPTNIIDWAISLDFWHNPDGVHHNTQWISYDGVKWWASPYDLDISYGWWAPHVMDNVSSPLGRGISYLPIRYIFSNNDYKTMAESRYASLRNSGILSLDNVYNKIMGFVKAVGLEYYKKEYEKWPGIASNRDTSVNTEYWELDLDGEGKPIYGEGDTWNDSVSYSVGDKVFHGYNAEMGYVRFTAVKSGTNNRPISEYGIRDSIWRLCSWMKRHIAYCDTNYNYNN